MISRSSTSLTRMYRCVMTPALLRKSNHFFVLKTPLRGLVTVTQTSSSSSLKANEIQVTSTESSKEKNYNYDNSAPVVITPSAIRQLQRLARLRSPDDPSQVYLRIFVDAGGCSGFQYKFELQQQKEEAIDPNEDVVISLPLKDGNIHNNTTVSQLPHTSQHDDNVYVVIDESSLNYLKGSTVDYVQEMIKSSFIVTNNPQSESACGCGSSFAVKNFSSNPALD